MTLMTIVTGRDFAAGVACVGAFVVAIVALLTGVARRRRCIDIERRRLDLIEEGLRDPSLDAATRAELLRSLAQRNDTWRGLAWRLVSNPATWRVLWFGSAWIVFIVSSGILIAEASGLFRSRAPVEVFLPSAAIGFAMLTLPTGLRELNRRLGAA